MTTAGSPKRSFAVSARRAVAFALLLPHGAPAITQGEQAYSVALHQHGSMSEALGSMEWHADRGQQTGAVDLIWWTDHDWRVEHWRHTVRYDFENATVNTASTVTEPDDAYAGEFRYWVRRGFSTTHSVSIVDSTVSEGTQALRFSSSDPNIGTTFFSLGLGQTASRKQNKYSLAKRVHVKFSLFPESLDPVDGKFVLQVILSEHPLQAHVVRYVAGSMEGEGAASIPVPYTLGQWNTYDFDITADAINLFTTGGADSLRAEDNSLEEVQIRLETRGTHEAVIFLDDYRIESDPAMDGAAILDKARDMGALYETMYPAVSHFVGTEISRFRAQPHLNGYAPGLTLVDYTGKVFSDSLFYAVDQIHAQGGAVSLNHVFGTGGYGTPGETEAQKDARVLSAKRGLIGARAYNVDVLEAGYRIRHGIDLVRFLDLWDALTGNAVFLTANGVTDSHGSDLYDGWGPWQPGNIQFENNFVTWLYSAQLDEAGLIHAMKAGRAFFGDPFVFDPDGTVDLCTAEGLPMGRVVLTDRSSHDVIVEIDGMPPTAQVRLLHGEIRESPPVEYVDVNYLRDEILSGTWNGTVFTDTVTIDTTLPGFVRVEVDDQGTATAFSNPIHFVTAVPALGVPAPRVAAALGDAVIRSAAEFTLTGASFTAGAVTSLVVQGDEETPGLGTLVIDTGILGQPTQVLGGGFTSYQFQNGVATIVGFTGAGSAVELQWDPTGVDVATGRIEALHLDASRPNPFGEGTVARFALPRAASVFLEVLDVRGRRIRLLADERFDPGFHRVAWDGRDSLGHPVAAGVYFFRITALGEVLSAKVVRIR